MLLAYSSTILYKIYKYSPNFAINFLFPRAVTKGCFAKQNRQKYRWRWNPVSLTSMAELPLNQKSKEKRFNRHLILKGIYMPSLKSGTQWFSNTLLCSGTNFKVQIPTCTNTFSIERVPYAWRGKNHCTLHSYFLAYISRITFIKSLQCISMGLVSQTGLTRKSKRTSRRQHSSTSNRNFPKSCIFC